MKAALLALSTTLCLGLALLSSHKPSSEQASTFSPIPLGIIAPLSGSYASYGEFIQQGARLAKDTLSKEGISIELFYEDACLPADGLKAGNKLIHLNKIQALVGNYCVVSLAAMYRNFARAGIPLYQSTVAPGELLSRSQYIFTTSTTIHNEAQALATYAFKDLGARTAVIMYLSTQWGEEFNQTFRQAFQSLGGEILASETHPIGSSDFRSELSKLKAKKPDVYFFAHLGSELGMLLKQTRDLGVRSQILTADEAEDPNVLATAGSAANGMRFLTPKILASQEEQERFEHKYRVKFGEASHPLAQNSYTATLRSARAVLSCKEEQECILRELRKSAQSNEHHKANKFTLKQVRNGGFETLRK